MLHIPLQIEPFILCDLAIKICNQFIKYAGKDSAAENVCPKPPVFIKRAVFFSNTKPKSPKVVIGANCLVKPVKSLIPVVGHRFAKQIRVLPHLHRQKNDRYDESDSDKNLCDEIGLFKVHCFLRFAHQH